MTSARGIADWLTASAERVPDAIAVEDGTSHALCYGTFAALADEVSQYLASIAVAPGARVVVLMRKSVDVLVTFHAIVRCGAVYVPADALAPVTRAAFMVRDSEAKVVIVDDDQAEGLAAALDELNWSARILPVPSRPLPGTRCRLDALTCKEPVAIARAADPNDVAFLLYTSGSTGGPKAVTITHGNVVAFIDWCSTWVRPTADDRVVVHAPLQFSLSVFNIYLPWKHGARVVLLDERTAKTPALVASRIERDRITIWFSTPTILTWLVRERLLQSIDAAALKLVIFSGEPIPTAILQELMAHVPWPRYVHALGSTETHMIARHEVPGGDLLTPQLPIGRVAEHFRHRIVDERQDDVPPGADGELCVTGPGVASGYWRRPDETAAAFFTDADGVRWYRTRDVVRALPDGTLTHHGRRDRLIKRRGNRVDLGEIEACLYQHFELKEVAVVAGEDAKRGVLILAIVVPVSGARPSIVQLKVHCAKRLPSYMVPDAFRFVAELPRTSNGKTDLPRLRALLQSEIASC